MSRSTQDHVNSTQYWQERFATGDWDRNRGEQQARFFGALAVRLLPSWAASDLRSNRRRVVDLGCAEGAGTAALAQALPECKVMGVDFAEAAITRARALHAGVEFAVGDLAAPPAGAEALVLSNVLEHLPDPHEALRRLATHPGLKFLVVLVPLHEVLRHHEHVVTFDYNNFPIRLGELSLAAFDEVDLRGTPDEAYWYGKQAFALWASDEVLAAAGPTLQSVMGSAHRAQMRLSTAQEQVRKLEQADRAALVELSDTRRRLAEVMAELREVERSSDALRRAEGAPAEAGGRATAVAVQFLPDREAEARAEHLRLKLEELERTLKWRWSSWLAEKARGSGFDPMLRLARSIDDVGLAGTAMRLKRAARRRLASRRRLMPLDVDPWVSLEPLKPIEVHVLDAGYVGEELPAFSVVTTIRNEEDSIVAFLRSIALQRATPSEVIVVDGGSTDDTVALVRAFARSAPFRVEVVDEGPCNIAAGRNKGLRLVREDIVVFLDAGCTLRPDFLSAMVGPFRSHPQTDLVGGIYLPAPDAPRATVFVPDWQRCDFSTFLPSARALAVRPFLARSMGGFPEYLSHTGEDTLFDIEYRRVSRKWVINRAAIVEWSGPADERGVQKLGRSYSRGDGESGVGDRRFYKWLSEHQRGFLGPVSERDQASFEGFLEGRERRRMVEGERRKVRGVVLIIDSAQLTDFGGDRRVAHLATELTRQHLKVVHVSALGPDDPGARYLELDQSLLELYHVNDFDPGDLADRYGERLLGGLVVGAHPALVSIVERVRARLPHLALVLDEADHVATERVKHDASAVTLPVLRRAVGARLVTSVADATGRPRSEALPDGADLRVYARGLHEERPKSWPVRWKERVVICPMPFEVSDLEGQFLRSVARANPTIGFVVLVPGWRFPVLADRWGIFERNLTGTTWRTPSELAGWTANAAAVVLPWECDAPSRVSWAIGWAHRAAAVGIPLVARGELGLEGVYSSPAATFSRATLAAVEGPDLTAMAPAQSWQRQVHRLLELFFEIRR